MAGKSVFRFSELHEPGETIEEAVARETMEEAGVAISPVHYHSTSLGHFQAR